MDSCTGTRDTKNDTHKKSYFFFLYHHRSPLLNHTMKCYKKKGYSKSFPPLKDYLHKLQKQQVNNEQSQTIHKVPSQKLHSYLCSKLPDGQEKHAIDQLLRENVELRELRLLFDQFQQIMRIKREPDALAPWIERTEKTEIKELNSLDIICGRIGRQFRMPQFINGVTGWSKAV